MATYDDYDVDEITLLNEKERQKMMETFRKSGLHGAKWPKIVFAVLVCTFNVNGKTKRGRQKAKRQQAFRSRKSGGTHAVEKIVDFLRRKLQQKSIFHRQTLRMYVNYSPCEQCSDAISGLMEEMKTRIPRVNLQISFPALYKIIRPSCFAGDHTARHRLPGKTEHENNLQGLTNLLDDDVDLQTFEASHWRDLSRFLGVTMFVSKTYPERYDDPYYGYADDDDKDYDYRDYIDYLMVYEKDPACPRRLEDEKLREDFESLIRDQVSMTYSDSDGWADNSSDDEDEYESGHHYDSDYDGRAAQDYDYYPSSKTPSAPQRSSWVRGPLNTGVYEQPERGITPVGVTLTPVSGVSSRTLQENRAVRPSVNATTQNIGRASQIVVNATTQNVARSWLRQFHATEQGSRRWAQGGVNVTPHSTTQTPQGGVNAATQSIARSPHSSVRSTTPSTIRTPQDDVEAAAHIITRTAQAGVNAATQSTAWTPQSDDDDRSSKSCCSSCTII